MKIWRGFTLTAWTALLAACVTFAVLYHAFDKTILDSTQTKRSLAESGVYEAVRDTALTDAVVNAVEERYPDNRLIGRDIIRATLADTLPAPALAERFEPAVNATYRWLDSKEQDLSFSVSLSGYEDTFYRSLEKRLGTTLASLESCGDNRYPPEEAILNDRCLPQYLSAREAQQATMGYLRAGDFPLEGTVTEENVFGIDGKSTGLEALPSYLNALWTFNILALIVGGVAVSFLLLTRKTVGLIAVGSGLLAGGVGALIAVLVMTQTTASLTETALAEALTTALMEPFASISTQTAVAVMAGGAVVTTVGVVWRRRARG